MKKIFVILVALIGFGFSSFGQNTVVVQTNSETKSGTQDECAYRINGICTTEDLGGVEVTLSAEGYGWYFFTFENYNDFTVSVIFEVENLGGEKKSGTMVLKASEKKKTSQSYKGQSIKTIARKLKN